MFSLQNLLRLDYEKILLLASVIFRGDYHRRSRFIEARQTFLHKIYDDYSQFISGLWELVNKPSTDRAKYRRSLAYAYLNRGGSDRNWDNLHESDLEKIHGLMNDNLTSKSDNASHDLNIWFETARRLPQTSLEYTIQKLIQWERVADGISILNVYYYLYILNAILTINGSEVSALHARTFSEKSKSLAQGRLNRTKTLDWVGTESNVLQLIPSSRLGRFDQNLGFFNTDDRKKLMQLSGRIHIINSGQSGTIKAHGLEFFFTPNPKTGAHQFFRERDNNQLVTFYAGFSYDGPRAWHVEPKASS